jgi:hypothetical protein
MITPQLEEIKFYLVKNGKKLDDRIFDEYHEAEFELNRLQLLDESAYEELTIDSYKVPNRRQLNG